ncbi:LytR C-terminal domain-containing protein [Speluncibacter jeojiensis]|uniref:LytR C-terminal domain-containing protein n=1 Tax=Speluncibacter jeojiensis TaxID=2710754 RepID=A0A9X4M3R5_9ACTN|nr:LytR C-terminal domain-containing protein [Rhodococcus sp. D2-41]MDG3016262.1 LytR C-terminal domain-containing protein [Corynebacteriales bacterium D3-21]
MKNPPPEPTGLPLRAAAMVLIAAAIVFAGLGWLSLGKSNPDSQPDTATAAVTSSLTTSAAPPAASSKVAAAAAPTGSAASAATTTTASAGAIADVPVRVFNNSDVGGLASRTAAKLRAEGWTVASVQNYTAGSIPTTTVYYGSGTGEQQAAQRIAGELGVGAAPRFAGIKDASPGVIVILTGAPTGF